MAPSGAGPIGGQGNSPAAHRSHRRLPVFNIPPEAGSNIFRNLVERGEGHGMSAPADHHTLKQFLVLLIANNHRLILLTITVGFAETRRQQTGVLQHLSRYHDGGGGGR